MTDKVQEIMAQIEEYAVLREYGSASQYDAAGRELESRLREVVAPPVPEPIYIEANLADCMGEWRRIAPDQVRQYKEAGWTVRFLVEATTPQPASEPVAWAVVAVNTGRMCQVTLDADDIEGHNPQHIVPLYATPQPAAKPAQAEPVARDGPVAWTNPEQLRRIKQGFGGYMSGSPEMHPEGEIALYLASSPTQPRPQPLTGDEA